ncbi:MAG: SAM-dependent methyltransferase [Myxococcales bacterium]|nr:SAM-dependent methyltransferase [Myxococcales bacterium]
MAEPLISNVSDTARWVAVYRAWESARPDALFRDPLADRLAGERGRAIAAAAPKQARSGWPMITRTKLIDDLIAQSLAEGCDRVVNLAAGLDTRPYRLDLPASLTWIEADLPGMIDEKERLLAGETPRCRLTRERVDLSDAAARAAFLDRALAGASKALVITEGLLIYLDDEQVRALARDLARPAARWWILDVTSAAIVAMIQKGMGKHLDNAPMKFAPRDGVAFFEKIGWKARDIRSIYRAAVRFRRVPLVMRLFAVFPDPDPRNPGKKFWSAVVRLER